MPNLNLVREYRNDFPESIFQLEEWERDAKIRRKRLTLPETPLSIGVMGQVKAGKSSFLNNMLFGGKSLLPEAATPKTANLTRIRYAEKPSFVARFYTPEEWDNIEKQAASDSMDDMTRAAKELLKSAKSSGDDIQNLLNQGKVEIKADSLDALMGELNTYVGGDGRLTALVSETELALPLDELVGIEIVDTPGMNDPVVSRTQKTREYMSQCDVVFFLSRASQFFDASDQGLLTLQLPQKGIKSLVLVAAQFDMAILDDGFNRSSLAVCKDRVVERLSNMAATTIEKLATQREQVGQTEVANLLRSVGAPIFASTHAALIAEAKNEKHLSSVVNHTRKELTELAIDCWSGELSHEDWVSLGNTVGLRMAYDKARNDKEIILERQREGLEKELEDSLRLILSEFRELAQARLDTLRNDDLASLAARESAEQLQLNKISSALSGYLHDATTKSEKRCKQIIDEIQSSAERAATLSEHTGYMTNQHREKISESKWYNPFSWGKHYYETYETTSSYTYFNTVDAIENLRYYVQTARRQLISAFDDLISPVALSAGLRRELLRSIDTSQPDFDPRALRALIETSLSGLSLPQVDFEVPDIEGYFTGFSGVVRELHDMEELRTRLSRSVSKINESIIKHLSHSVNGVNESLNEIADQLHGKLTEKLREEINTLRTAMADKEKNIEAIEEVLSAIQRVK